MTIQVIKKDGTFQDWDPFKVVRAVNLAKQRVNEPISTEEMEEVVELVLEDISEMNEVSVSDIHTSVENSLMEIHKFDIAREYIQYRYSHKRDLYKPRKSYRPFEYPELHAYVDAIRQSYWTHDEFDMTSDVQDFKVHMTPTEKEATRRCALAISHVEATVKSFWTKLGDRLPKPEIAEVGVTMGESEVRHANAYAEILNVLSLNDDFEGILQVPAIRKRQEYMDRALAGKNGDDREYLKTVIFFSLFVENTSLFSQFLIIMMMNQQQNYLKGMSNVISATGLEETLHANLGADIVNIRREESPEWFTDDLHTEVVEMIEESYQAEKAIIDWIFELGEIDAVPKRVVVEYIKNRYNKGLVAAGFEPYFQVDSSLLTDTEFFDLQMVTTSHVDFFSKRSSNYTKKSQAFDEDSLF